MNVGKRFEALVKSALFAPAILARYGTIRPTRVNVHGCPNAIYIDPNDARARIKFIRDPIRGRISPPLRFWRAFIAHLRPDLALDVGVNFGECLFGTDYPACTRVLGVEANPLLQPYLQRSRAEHPSAARLHLFDCLVSDVRADAVPFWVDTRWSGNSSATPGAMDTPGIRRFDLRAELLDSLIGLGQARGKTLLYKMDIEGFECRALRGFARTLADAALAVGFVEFDSEFTASAGVPPQEHISGLLEHLDIYRTDPAAPNRLISVHAFGDLPRSRARDGRIHTDLVLVTKGTAASRWLAPGWSIDAVSP